MQGVPFDKLRGEAVVVYADPLASRLPLTPTFGWGQGKLSENGTILTGLRSTAEGRTPPSFGLGCFTTQQMRYHRLSRRVEFAGY
jgi:hypothetical protein